MKEVTRSQASASSCHTSSKSGSKGSIDSGAVSSGLVGSSSSTNKYVGSGNPGPARVELSKPGEEKYDPKAREFRRRQFLAMLKADVGREELLGENPWSGTVEDEEPRHLIVWRQALKGQPFDDGDVSVRLGGYKVQDLD